jgi:hypothetical protein
MIPERHPLNPQSVPTAMTRPSTPHLPRALFLHQSPPMLLPLQPLLLGRLQALQPQDLRRLLLQVALLLLLLQERVLESTCLSMEAWSWVWLDWLVLSCKYFDERVW